MNGCLIMQVQKDEVKNRISEAALEEFLVAGYQQASMRNIAAKAGITVGNIYSYYSGKHDLFDKILESTLEEIRNLLSYQVNKNVDSNSYIAQLTDEITKVFLNNRAQFLILMNGCEGSDYENLVKSGLVKLASNRISEELLPKLCLEKMDTLLADSVSIALIEGLFNIFNKYGHEEERLSTLLSLFLTIFFGNINTK